jgi:hypothetical protein
LFYEFSLGGAYRRDPQADDWIGKAVAEVLDLDEEADRKQVRAILKTWFASRVLTTAERKDENRHAKKFVVPGTGTRRKATRRGTHPAD